MADIGLIGIGLVGSALAARFRQAGRTVIGFDRRPEASVALAAVGGTVATSAAEVAQNAATVVLSLPHSDAVESVVAVMGPALAGGTVIDTTTGDPDRTEALGERLAGQGIDYLDATIIGSSRLVREGQAVVAAGGRADVFRRCTDLLDTFAAREFHVGPWGSGARMKLVVNLVLGLNRAILAEGLAFAGASGFDPTLALEVLRSGAAYSRVMDAKGRRMIDRDFTPEARLSQHHKDVRLILAAAKRVGLDLPLSAVHDELLTHLDEHGLGDFDNSAIIRAYDGGRGPEMEYRTLGRTGLSVSVLAFGAGPVSGLMTGDDMDAQLATLRRALARGINWIDTAAGYGQGKSEVNLGRALRELDAPADLHIATKVRLTAGDLGDIGGAVRRSVEGSLSRLGLPGVTVLQLHNGLTAERDAEPFSITPADVLEPGGVLDAFADLRAAGLVRFLGLTGTGQPAAQREAIHSGGFDTLQVPYHVLNPSAGQPVPVEFTETDYGQIITDAAAERMGVFAIRVFAGGALLGREPSSHTRTTPFFPLALYERDRQRAGGLSKADALRFVLGDPRVHAALIGFGAPAHVDELVDLTSGAPTA